MVIRSAPASPLVPVPDCQLAETESDSEGSPASFVICSLMSEMSVSISVMSLTKVKKAGKFSSSQIMVSGLTLFL